MGGCWRPGSRRGPYDPALEIRTRPEGHVGAGPRARRTAHVAWSTQIAARTTVVRFGHDRAVKELAEMAGPQFDPDVVKALLTIAEGGAEQLNRRIHEDFDENFLGLGIGSVDAKATGKNFKAEVDRQTKLLATES